MSCAAGLNRTFARSHDDCLGGLAMLAMTVPASWTRGVVLAASIALAGPVLVSVQTMDIYFIDVEGGQSTLVVSPSGQSLLVDIGWPGFDGRDAIRIAAVAKCAGVTVIDYLVLTHY